VDLDRDERHLQIELTVSAIQKEMAMIRWRNVRSTGASKARYIVAREYAEALKRHKRALVTQQPTELRGGGSWNYNLGGIEMGDEVQKPKSSEDLRKAVVEAYQLVQQAHAGYHEALAIIADTDHSPDGALAFQQRGREYGYAVRRYSDAVMVWLSHMETNRKNAVKQLSKHATAD